MKNESRKSRRWIVEACIQDDWVEWCAARDENAARACAKLLQADLASERVEFRVRLAGEIVQDDPLCDITGWTADQRAMIG